MKKLSKIVALLLAGAMAMVMLTACTGGNGPNTPGNPKEQEMMKKITSSSQGKGIKENDPDLYQNCIDGSEYRYQGSQRKGRRVQG